MNKKIIVVVLVCVALAGMALYYFNPFRGTGEHCILIPANSSMIVSFDLESLSKKADLKDKFKQTKLYKKLTESKGSTMSKEASAIISKILENPRKCGLDLSDDAYLYRHYHTNYGERYGVVVSINNEKEFSDFIKAIPGMKEKITEKKGYMLLTGDKHYMAWSEKGLLIVMNNRREMDYMYFGDMHNDNDKGTTESYINELMSQQATKSARVKPEFQRFARQGNDIGYFLNYGKSFEEESQNSYNPMSSFFKMFNGLYFRGGVDFEKNKVISDGQFDGKEEVLKNFKYLKRDGVSSKVLPYVAGEHLYLSGSINLDIDNILAMVKENFGKVGLENSLQQLGLSEKELSGMVTGEITISLIDIRERQVPDYNYRVNPETGMFERYDTVKRELSPIFIANLGISDKKGFHKVLSKIFGEPDHDMYQQNFGGMSVYIVDNPFGVSIVNDKGLAENILKGKGTKEPPKDIANMMTDQPGSFYLDLNIKDYPEAAIDKLMKSTNGKKSQFTNFMSIFENYKGYGKIENFKYELNLVEGEGNSLYRILKQFDVIDFDEPKEVPNVYEAPGVVADSLDTPPPMVDPGMQ